MMSEKRFEVDGVEVERFMLVFGDDGTRVVDNQTGKELYAIDVVDLLNEQQAIITELNKQIEQLNLAIDDLLSHTSCEEVKKENSDLRQNITIIKDLLSECDLFSDKATKHDIIAYKEMRQFDNKDAYCICTAIKKAIEKLKRCNDE